jgi:hypothetical protein
VHLPTSFSHDVQFSAASAIQFQQKLVQGHTSASHSLQFSHFSIFQFQQIGLFQSPMHMSPKSNGQFSQSSFSSIL